MNSPNELQDRESSFDITAFTNNFVDAIEEGNESKITMLMKGLSNNQVAPFRQFSAKFDKQAKLLKYIFSPQFQNLPAELRAQIRTQFLNGLDYSIRNGQIYRANQLTPFELYDSLVKLKNAPGDKSRQITSLFNKTFMYCYELADRKKDTDPKEYQSLLNIFDQIRKLFIEISFYNFVFFFNYLLYRFSNNGDTLKYLVEIIKLSVSSLDKDKSLKQKRQSFFKDFRSFFFQELKTTIVSETESIFELLTSCNDALTKPEKNLLVNCLRLANVTNEQKFLIYLRVLKFDQSLNLEIVEVRTLANQLTKISLEDLAILESIIKACGSINPDCLQFLEIHDLLAKKVNAPTICSKYTGYKSVQEYAQQMGGEYNKNDSIRKCLFTFACACYSRNFQVIDQVINNTLEILPDNISADDIRLNLFDLFNSSPFDHIYDHFVQKYSENDNVTLMLLRSGSTEVIRRMDNKTFEKWLKWPKMLTVFIKKLAINPSFREAFLDRAEKLSALEIATRTKFFNEASQDGFLLDQALLKLQDDLLAIRLYKLGARKIFNQVDSADIFVTALSFGCIQFALYLLDNCKSLRSETKGIQLLNSKVRTAILQSGLAITKFPSLGANDVQLSLNHLIDESVSDPIQSLLQSIKMKYILETITPNEQILINLHRSQEYLSLQEIYKKTTLSDSALIDFFANDTNTSLNPDKAILVAQNSNLIRCLDSRKSWTYATKKNQLQMPKDFIVLQPPATPWENKPSHEVTRATLKSRYLGQHPFTATLLIDLLKNKQDNTNEDDKLPNQELYLLFNKHIVMGEFQSPVLAYLFLSFPELTFDLEDKDLPDVKYLSLAVFMLIRASYACSEQFLKLLAQLTALNSRFATIVQQSQQQTIFCENLPAFLRRVRPEHADLITSSFSTLLLKLSSDKAAKTTILNQDEDPTTRFEQALNTDDINGYKILARDFPNFFRNYILSHALKVCSKDDSKILTFLFKQHKLQNIKFTPHEIAKILEEIIRTNESGTNLTHASQYNFIVTPDIFYLLALKQSKYDCADALMPSFVSSDLLRETAKLGTVALLKRALNANCRLESKEEHLISYQELENICINDRDKLTAIALSRITTKKQWEDRFGATAAKKTRKIKTTNPNDKDKFNEFMHRLELCKRYSKLYTDSKELSLDDFKACNLILKKLKKAYERCGHEAVTKYLNDTSLSQQLKPFLQSTVIEVNKLEKKASLLESIIVAQLESLYSIFNTERKPKEKNTASINSREDKTIKKKKKDKGRKRSKSFPTPSNNPLVVVEGPGLYGFFEQKKLGSEENFTDTKEEQEDAISHHESDSLLAINKEIASILEEIIAFTAQIADAPELQFFPEKECNFLLEKYMQLKELFWELDDDLSKSSPFHSHKVLLELFDCNQTADDVKRHVTLLANQFVLQAKQAPTPIKNVESEKAKSFTFFQPAILREDINQFCLKRLTELRQLLLTPEIDDVHFCIFRIVNALGDVYRPARRIRHLLIHEFYNINKQDLIILAQNLLKIDLADKGTFLSIEKCALYEQSLEFMQLILRPGKRPKADLHKILHNTVEKLRMSHDAHNNRQMMWQSVLLGELAKQMDICSSPGITRHTESQCQILRNRVAHEDYKKSLANEGDPTLLCNARISRAELIASTLKTIFVSAPLKPL